MPIRHGDGLPHSSHLTDIFLIVRSRLVSIVLVGAVVAISAPGVAAAKPTNTHHKKTSLTAARKLRAAVAKAKRSPDLWATVNMCSSSPAEDVVGIRGQMPSLGIPATMVMNISVSYFNTTDNMFESANDSNDRKSISLGMGTHGLHQSGVNFKFHPPASGSTFVVRGTITFEWLIGSKVVGKVTRNTGHGYANVGFSSPPGYSAGTCALT